MAGTPSRDDATPPPRKPGAEVVTFEHPTLVRATACVLRSILAAVTRKDWHGVDNIPQVGEAFIAVSNHVSYADPLTFAHFLYNAGRVPRFLAKAPLFDLPIVGKVLHACGQIPVFRGSARAKDAVDAGTQALANGGTIAVFPEGTLTRDPALWPMVARTGVARMALETGVPVVPVAQWGAHRILMPYGKVPRVFPPRRITVVAGPPIDLQAFRDKPIDNEVLRGATDVIMATLIAMVADIRGEQPPTELFDMRKKDQA